MAFDRFGRYLIPPRDGDDPVAHTRATTLANSVVDRFGLERWGQRVLARGLIERPELLTAIAATPDSDHDRTDELVEQAREAGGASTASTLGSALHQFAERLDKGEELHVPAPHSADLDAYRRRLAEAGFTVTHVETTVVVPELTVAGTVDRIVSKGGRSYVLDLKTGASLGFGWASIAIQLACYAHAESVYDLVADEHRPMPDVSKTLGIVAHVPAGQGTCELIGVDLEVGWRGALLARAVREYRGEAFRRPLAESGDRREWVIGRVKRLVAHYPEAATALAARWPSDLPTLKAGGHTDAELQKVIDMVSYVEGDYRVPFPDEPDPALPSVTKAKPMVTRDAHGPRLQT